MLGRLSLRTSLTLLSAAAALLIATSARAAYAPVAAPLVLEQYVIVHDALASDNTEGVAAAIDLMRTLVAKRIALAGDDERPLFEAVDRAAARFVDADLDAQREAMKGLTVAVDALLRAGQAEGWQLYHCPMAGEGGYWIQTTEGVRNPYYGAAMLKCGNKVEQIAAPAATGAG